MRLITPEVLKTLQPSKMLLLSFISLFHATVLALLFSPSPIALGTLILFLALQLSLIFSLFSSS